MSSTTEISEQMSKLLDDAVEAVEKKKDKDEDLDNIKKRARKPPAEGPCKRCGEDKPLNRVMLCYKCWVISNLEERGWTEGQPHPKSCSCDLECCNTSKGGFN